jgi:MSHA biogenesis protein MshP
MYPKLTEQRGSALVIAVFIIVIMLLLALGISRLLRSGSETVVYEVQGTRTLFAAQSALELALTQLYPLNSGTAACAALTTDYSFSSGALASCSATVSCLAYTDTSPGEATLFQLSSTATCNAGSVQTQRTVRIEVRE